MLVAALAMCLQGLAFGSAAAAHRAPEPSAAVSAICIPASDEDRQAPFCDHGRSHCCLPGESCEHWPASALAEPLEPVRSTSVTHLVAAARLGDAPPLPPAGWASSWSAQAPPRFS